MTSISKSVGPSVFSHGASGVEAVAGNAGKIAVPLLNPYASGQGGAGPASVLKRDGAGQAPVLSGAQPADVRSARKTRSTEQPDNLYSRAIADSAVAKAFSRASASYVFQVTTHPADVLVAPESTLGLWRTELDNAFNAPRFLAWAKEQGLDTAKLKLNPSSGELTGLVGDTMKTFSLKDISGWSEVSRALLSIAKVIVPEPGHVIDHPWPEGKVPMHEVGRFYNKPTQLSAAQALTQLHKLKGHERFSFDPIPHASRRSPESLTEQQVALGDDANTYAIVTALKRQVDEAAMRVNSLEAREPVNPELKRQLKDEASRINLDKIMVPIDPRSTYAIKSDEPSDEASLADILETYSLDVPKEAKDADNLANVLSFDLTIRAPDADKGGALPLTRSSGSAPLSQASQEQLLQVVAQWKADSKVPVLDAQSSKGADSLMGRLMRNLPEAIKKTMKDNPAAALDALIRLPDAKALGERLQEALKGEPTQTSALEFVSAALAIDLDPTAGASRFNLAGYDVYAQENVGASPAEIKQRFIRHLEAKVVVDAAPVAAHLLLLVSAPEFLANEFPPGTVYGSHTWANYSIEALRIEKQVPGAVANMTFSQVMLFGQTEPISQGGFTQLKEVRRGPVLDWAVANGVISARVDNGYPPEDYNLAVAAMIKQQKQLSWAGKALVSKAPTRKELAIAELKRVFGQGIDVEKKVLKDHHGDLLFNYSYSLVDIYMSGELYTKVWDSTDEKAVPIRKLHIKKGEAPLNPDINSAFEKSFDAYKVKKREAVNTLFRYHVSLLPAQDRKIFDNADVSFYAVRKPLDRMSIVKRGGRERAVASTVKPTPKEVAALTGRQGVLIQADRGNGKIDYYSYFPKLAKIVKEPGLSEPLKSTPQEPWKTPNPLPVNPRGDLLAFDDSPYHVAAPTDDRRSRVLVERLALPNTDRLDAKVPSDTAEGLKGSYFSKRNVELGSTVSHHFLPGFDYEKTVAKGVTDREQERITNRKLDEFFLGIVPFHDGIKHVINGEYRAAAVDLGLDILGFLVPAAGHSRKALKAGKGLFKAVASGAVKGVASSFSFDDFLSAPKNIKNGLRATGREVSNLTTALPKLLPKSARSYDVQKVYKQNDVVTAFYRKFTGADVEMTPITAIFLNGGWYAYNVITKTPFGVPLVQDSLISAVAG